MSAPHISLDEVLDSMDPAARAEAMKPTFMEPLKLFLEGLNNMPEFSTEAKKMMTGMIK